MSTATQLLDSVIDTLAPLWVELSFLLFFSAGFLCIQGDFFTGKGSPKKPGLRKGNAAGRKSAESAATFKPAAVKTIEAEAAAGNSAQLLEVWRAEQSSAATPKELLKAVVQGFLDAEPESLQQEIVEHMKLHKNFLGSSQAAVLVLDPVARSGNVEIMMDLFRAFPMKLGIMHSCLMYEVILGGFASAGRPEKVDEIHSQMKRDRFKLSPRGFSLMIKGFLKNGLLENVFKTIVQMAEAGHSVPAYAVTQFLRVAADSGKVMEMWNLVKEKGIDLCSDAVALILDDCQRTHNMQLAQEVEQVARSKQIPMGMQCYDALLKIYAENCNPKASTIFKEMQSEGHKPSEGLCVGILVRCADGKFLGFADEIVRYVRANSGMTIALYSALMKVYADSGIYDKACDLYEQILNDGLTPDQMMYGCLMKFSVECGRTALSQQLSEKLSVLDIQNYMSLIKAAGRDRDVERAFGIIQRLRDNNVTPDAIAFNSVLDVCVKAKDLKRAQQLVQEMKAVGLVDVITYNTLLKGYCQAGDIKGAKGLMREMEDVGMPPNDVSYNCLLNAAVNCGSLHEAWDIVDKMEEMKVQPDHYTVSILLKALKRMRGSKDVARCFDFLDRSGIDPCSDEILLNTVLETYSRHNEHRRLKALLDNFEQSKLRPSVPTYGSIIKAYSNLKRPDKCWQCWNEMQSKRGLEPTEIVFGCMLDALVCNGQVDQATTLLEESQMKPNAVICSILVKGYASTGQSDRASELWHKMRGIGVKMNTAACNAFIDAQARVGNMEEVLQIVQAMGEHGCELDGITHSTIVKGYTVKGDLEKAMDVLRGMQKSGVHHDAIVYNTILDGCSKHRRMDLIDVVLESMRAHKVAPTNFTLGILLKSYSRQKSLDKAFEAMATLPKQGNFIPNSQVYSSLMGACLTNGQPARAMTVFNDMRAAGFSADSRACTSLVAGLVRRGQLHDAVHVVDEVYGLNGSRRSVGTVETNTLESLLTALSNQGLGEEVAAPLFERLRAAKVPVSCKLMASAFAFDGDRATHPWSNSSRAR
eukprot:TRINITY_DN5759_c0_g1_i5.p1 TRINITY_DN5759_c0_g1~~TRINITY_DN5759_c0_g1_i5.p1  ORF type:complete len:1039 (+),score=247.94 TRINITY_DN5759_c0_g1_i5:150-3266(+)